MEQRIHATIIVICLSKYGAYSIIDLKYDPRVEENIRTLMLGFIVVAFHVCLLRVLWRNICKTYLWMDNPPRIHESYIIYCVYL